MWPERQDRARTDYAKLSKDYPYSPALSEAKKAIMQTYGQPQSDRKIPLALLSFPLALISQIYLLFYRRSMLVRGH